MKQELSEGVLKSLLKNKPDTGRIEVSDTKRPGLRFRLSSSGQAVWMYEKRVKGGPKRKHTLGKHSKEFGLAEARAQALLLEVEAAQGVDRVAISRAKKLEEEATKARALSVRQVLNLYDQLHLSNLRTGEERRKQIEQSLLEKLDLPIAKLRRADLQLAIDQKASADHKTAANRVRAALKAFTKWAAGRDHIASDIGLELPKPFKENSRKREPSIEEIHAIWDASYKLGNLWGPPLRLLILTAQRRQEIFGLKWSELNFAAATISKSGDKTKNAQEHVTHLSKPALAELCALREAAGDDPSGYIFTTTGRTPISGFSQVKARMDKLLGEDFEPWRLHDLRTSFATAMVERGIPENVADRVLNHSAVGSAPSAVARVYNRAGLLEQRARALDLWARLVTEDQATVVKIHG
ncbi:tyrosine-type recombinase/integrase [Sulfitobacter mediterraneus]|uniref:tyrosine-type recombinase/integrase n=1 Tax=Sulfitobacter mediterraneus TaxID=83219 RepID=UPI0021A6CF1A|nr:site-specific integrase [Sulfitobacter mediterraneus]UWR10944.1 tyrosine-type recombinase/integrase [Sulfitobacter mediterraneus]